MRTILFASDLDNTLLFSHRHRQPEDRCVERLNGAEQGFFTQDTLDLLPQVVRRVHLLPITTRSVEQYLRIQWPEGTVPRWALTANGAVLLRDGEVDRAWYAASQALVRDHREALAAVLDHLTRQGGATSVRCVEGVYVYAAYPDTPTAERVARDWCGGSALRAVVSGRKVYFFPPGIDKGPALRRAVEIRPACRFWGSPDPAPEKAWQAAMPFLPSMRQFAFRGRLCAPPHGRTTAGGSPGNPRPLSWRTSAGGVPAE